MRQDAGPAPATIACRETAALSRRAFVRVAAGLGLAAVGTALGCAPGRPAGGAAAASGAVAGAVAAGDPVKRTFFAFDTVVSLTVYGSEQLADALVERCERFEALLSRTREGSDVWRVNQAAGAPVEVAPETAAVIARGLEYGRRSAGLFDITIGSVSSLWDFKEGVRPSDEAVAEAVRHVGYDRVRLDGCTVTMEDPQALLDLGGIAKGCIADDLAAMLRDAGCASAIINLGGNVAVVGSKPDGTPWKVGIQDPNAPTSTAVMAALDCADASVVTSGLYERTFSLDGRSYHHILDPRTGFPAETDLVSSSIVCASSTDGDALATWMFLLGRDGALAHLEGLADVEGLVAGVDGERAMTSGAAFELR
ncbi:MAG: FAD:protein FMN transferase [Eggerthellaceae bacterium]|nr:FAD:protein FMN transferase [Eggerthellaceae bacterium]